MSDKWKIGWGISNRCNMGCRFCYSRNARKEPNYKDNIRAGFQFIINNKERIESINFGTGEPTIEPELFELCDAIRREAPHISIGITTNGTLVEALEDPHRLDVFRRCIDDVDVSLDYGDQARQDQSRNHPGAFMMAVRSLKVCRQYGKKTTIVNALHKYNGTRENMDSLMRLSRIYDASLRINIYRPTVGFDYVIGYDQLKEILIRFVRNQQVESLADPLFASLFHVPCPAGDPVARSSFRILPNGYISPSTYLLDREWQEHRIDEIRDIDALHDFACFRKILLAPVPKACSSCPYVAICRGGVIDRRWLWYHDLNRRDPYCPYKNHDQDDWVSLSGDAVCASEKKSFVHDGYLPTLIFGPQPNERTLNSWDHIFLSEDKAYGASNPEPIVTEAALMLPGSARVLDLGAGPGRNGLYYLRKGHDVTFVDSSKIALDRIAETILTENSAAAYTVMEADIADALRALPDDTMDAVLAIHVISHGTPEVIEKGYVREMHRILKPGGVLAVTIPSLDDARCAAHPDITDGIRSFAFTEGAEAGIIHSFYSEEAALKLFREFEVLKMEEIRSGECAHYHMLLRKFFPKEKR